MWKPLCAAALALWMSACAGTPHHLTVENIGDREVHVVRVPLLPPDAGGDITLDVIYTRSHEWVSSWEMAAGANAGPSPRRIPEDNDPRFRAFRALITAAEAGDVAAVDWLLGQGAPLSWNTTSDSPLVSAAGSQRRAVVERLLRDHASTFALPDIEEAVWRASDPNEDDISALRRLVGRFGTRLTPAARVRILRKAAESNRLNEGRLVPAGPAIRYLIDEAGFDVNLPIADDGDTLLDFVGSGNEHRRDDRLLSSLKTRGAVSGRRR